MRILPVIDWLNGSVVRGVAGRRHEYRPIVSQLTKRTDPVSIAMAFREHFGCDELYFADLDAIAGRPPALAVYDALHRAGFRLWVDAGLKTRPDAEPLLAQGVASIIVGSETVACLEALADLLALVSPTRLVFSLDLKQGQPLTRIRGWHTLAPFAIARQVVACGVQRMLILDLAKVGVGAGVGTEALCRSIRQELPIIEVVAGGGVRGIEDVASMRDAGVDWLLIASALHDFRFDRAKLAAACG